MANQQWTEEEWQEWVQWTQEAGQPEGSSNAAPAAADPVAAAGSSSAEGNAMGKGKGKDCEKGKGKGETKGKGKGKGKQGKNQQWKWDTPGGPSRKRRDEERLEQEVRNLLRTTKGMPLSAAPLQAQIRWERKLRVAEAIRQNATDGVMAEAVLLQAQQMAVGPGVNLTPSYLPPRFPVRPEAPQHQFSFQGASMQGNSTQAAAPHQVHQGKGASMQGKAAPLPQHVPQVSFPQAPTKGNSSKAAAPPLPQQFHQGKGASRPPLPQQMQPCCQGVPQTPALTAAAAMGGKGTLYPRPYGPPEPQNPTQKGISSSSGKIVVELKRIGGLNAESYHHVLLLKKAFRLCWQRDQRLSSWHGSSAAAPRQPPLRA